MKQINEKNRHKLQLLIEKITAFSCVDVSLSEIVGTQNSANNAKILNN